MCVFATGRRWSARCSLSPSRARSQPRNAAGRIRSLEADLPAAHPPLERFLGPPGMRAAAALRHGSGRRNVSYRDLPARHRSRALESRLCAAIAPAEGRPLRRESKPAAALLPVPGGAEAIPGRDPGDLPRSEEHTSELQSRLHLVCRLLLEKKKIITYTT